MDKDRQNLTGSWSGQYAYPRRRGPVTPFLAMIEERGGFLTGTIVEPDLRRGGTVTASLAGARHGAAIDFTKTYASDSPNAYANPVDYVGQLSADGNSITGVWSLLMLDGTFEMHREAELDEEVSEEISERIPEPVDGDRG